MIELKEFQQKAADQIAERFAKYYEAPPMRGTRGNLRVVPFYQGARLDHRIGKTVILADAVSTICGACSRSSRWCSGCRRARSSSTRATRTCRRAASTTTSSDQRAFSYLAKYDPIDVREAKEPLIYFATVGTFNQKDKEEGARLIFKSEIDTAEDSTWEALKLRLTLRTTGARCCSSTTRGTT